MASKSMTRAGRQGALEEARELISLVASLEESGDFLSVEAVERRLGCGRERAEKLVSLLLEASTGGSRIALAVDENNDYTLLGGMNALHGRRLRLTPNETSALAAALDALKVDRDDPLYVKLSGSFSSCTVDENLMRSVLSLRPDDAAARNILSCSQAIAAHATLRFSYRGENDHEAAEREVVPQSIRQENELWYLDAFDLQRNGQRTFRLDRMEEPVQSGRAPLDAASAKGPDHGDTRHVRLTFRDTRYLNLFEWPDLALDAEDKDGGQTGSVTGTIPYFGGGWLPRRIAACGGTVTCDDREVNSLAAAHADKLLSLAAEAARV